MSRNKGIIKAFEEILKQKVYTYENSHLMGAIGAAIVSKGESEVDFSFDFDDSIIDVEIGMM